MFNTLTAYVKDKNTFLENAKNHPDYNTLLKFCNYFNTLIDNLREDKKNGNKNSNNIKTEQEILEIIKKEVRI